MNHANNRNFFQIVYIQGYKYIFVLKTFLVYFNINKQTLSFLHLVCQIHMTYINSTLIVNIFTNTL